MNRFAFPMLLLGMSLELPCSPCSGQAEANPFASNAATELTGGYSDLRALEAAWRQQYQADRERARAELALGRKAWITAGDSFVATVGRRVPYEFQYALMLELTCQDARPDASPELLNIAAEGFAELFDMQHDRAALVTLLSRRCPETVHGRPVDVWIAMQHYQPAVPGEKPTAYLPNSASGLYNGILALCDALDQSTQNKTRSVIARALRHAFRPYLALPADESKIAATSRQWYSLHRKEFYVSPGSWMPGRSPGSDPATDALFRPLTATKK